MLDKVKQVYNEIGKSFSDTRIRNWPEILPYLEKLKDGDKVLDLGCGNGRLLTGIKAKVDYLGIDFSDALIAEAKKLYPKRKFVTGDITDEATWKKLGKYNAIFCVAVLHHIPERKEQLFILQCIKDHITKAGFVMVAVWNLCQLRLLKHHFSGDSLKLKLSNRRWLYVPYQRKYKRFSVAFDKGYLKGLVEESGMKISKMFYSGKDGEKTNWIKGRNLCVEIRLR